MLEVKNLTKQYPGFTIKDLSFKVRKGEYYILLGRSGSGKSVTLELISGLRKPESGTIYLNGNDITRKRIQERKIGLVFQDFAVFPHLSVFANIAYPLKTKKLSRVLINEKVKVIADEMNISHLLDRKPDTLSGGERQRVAVARTLVSSPDIILLDEPMASIDTPLRDDLRRLLRMINSRGMTIMHVTHDFREAIRLADTVGVMHNGHIVQEGKPDDVFAAPVNRFVARFAGIQNFFKVEIKTMEGKSRGEGRNGCVFNLPEGNYPARGLVMIRNEDISVSVIQPVVADNIVEGTISELNRSEFGYEAYVKAGEIFYVNFSGHLCHEMNLEEGKRVFLTFSSESLRLIK